MWLTSRMGPTAGTGAHEAPHEAHLSNTNAPLILVVVVVAVAVIGNRIAGAITALSAAVWFDF
ncbi:hypothetical protein FBY22_3409 [Streptomyces sp. SLBN-31]|nr:hypothetical protein FBY22_3409 [Streptomyces sp. SLBN-31]